MSESTSTWMKQSTSGASMLSPTHYGTDIKEDWPPLPRAGRALSMGLCDCAANVDMGIGGEVVPGWMGHY